MYHFALLALLALATVKAVDFLADNVPALSRMRSAMTFVLALVAVFALDWSLFESWEVAVRDRDLGMWLTGFMVAGMTVPWRAVFGYLTHDKATADETLGDHVPMIGKAA